MCVSFGLKRYSRLSPKSPKRSCILDIESAILDGEITKTETDDPRGPRYTIVGLAEDRKTEVGVVGRFTETGTYLIITVYEVTEPEVW